MTQQTICLSKRKSNGYIYQWMGGNTFKNIITGESGEVAPEKAREVFTLPVSFNLMVNKNPYIIDLVKELKLALD
jgi:hypothetical protein